MGDTRVVYRVMGGRPERKTPLERSRHKWEIDIQLIFKKWDGEARTGLSGPG